MTPRPPSEVSAALRDIRKRPTLMTTDEQRWEAATCIDSLSHALAEVTEEAREAQKFIAELDALRVERDRLTRALSEARLTLIPLQVDKAAAEKMALETGRELAEAREALASERGRGDKLQSAQPWADVQRLTAELTRAGTERETLERLAETLKDRVEKAEALCYVPGVLKCAKCGCVLITTNLHADTGQFSANNDPQRCPNDCGPMWRRTEREAGNELCDRLDSMNDKLKAADSSLREHAEAIVVLRDALAPFAAVVSWMSSMRDLDRSVRFTLSFYANSSGTGGSCCFKESDFEKADKALSNPLASRLLAEREAERAVVRAARRWVDSLQAAGKRYGVHYTGSPEYQYVADALAALPASPSDKDMGK